MVACFRPSLSWTCVIELAFTNHDKTLAVKCGNRTVARKSSEGRLSICTEVLDILKFEQAPLFHSASYFNLEVLGGSIGE